MKENEIKPIDELNKSETEKSLPEEELEKVAAGADIVNPQITDAIT